METQQLLYSILKQKMVGEFANDPHLLKTFMCGFARFNELKQISLVKVHFLRFNPCLEPQNENLGSGGWFKPGVFNSRLSTGSTQVIFCSVHHGLWSMDLHGERFEVRENA